MRKVAVIVLALTATITASGEVRAQTPIEARVQQLEDTIRLLEARVASLEAQMLDRGATRSVKPDKANWRKLRRGMTEAEVEQLLGSPSRVEASPASTRWYYGDSPLSGIVSFNARSGELQMWDEPSR